MCNAKLLFEIKSLLKSKSSWSFKTSFLITGVTESSGWGVMVSDKDDEDEVGDEAELGVTDLYCGTDKITFLALCPLASSCLRLRSSGEPESPGGPVSLLVSELMICFTGLAPFLLLAPVGLLTLAWAWLGGLAGPTSMILVLKSEEVVRILRHSAEMGEGCVINVSMMISLKSLASQCDT